MIGLFILLLAGRQLVQPKPRSSNDITTVNNAATAKHPKPDAEYKPEEQHNSLDRRPCAGRQAGRQAGILQPRKIHNLARGMVSRDLHIQSRTGIAQVLCDEHGAFLADEEGRLQTSQH